jgi:hypothetical protein
MQLFMNNGGDDMHSKLRAMMEEYLKALPPEKFGEDDDETARGKYTEAGKLVEHLATIGDQLRERDLEADINSEGFICYLMNELLRVAFNQERMGAAVALDAASKEPVAPQMLRPGYMFHALAHYLFIMGRAYQRVTTEMGDMSSVLEDLAESAANDAPED